MLLIILCDGYHLTGNGFRTALLQVAIRSKVWLIDVMTLGRSQRHKDKWIPFFRQLFCTDAIKLGYDFSNDLRVGLGALAVSLDLVILLTDESLGSHGHLPISDRAHWQGAKRHLSLQNADPCQGSLAGAQSVRWK